MGRLLLHHSTPSRPLGRLRLAQRPLGRLLALQSCQFLLRPCQSFTENVNLEIGSREKALLAGDLYRTLGLLEGGSTADYCPARSWHGAPPSAAGLAREAVVPGPGRYPGL